MTIRILADSACNVSKRDRDDLNIEMIPLHVNIDEKEYLDGITITTKEIYDAMRVGKRPKTSQATPKDFSIAFTSCAENNQPLIYFAVSSPLSGTYESAKIMEKEIKNKYPDAPLYIVDTKCIALGYGLIIIRAAQLANEGASVEEIIEMGTYHAEHMEHIITVDNLEYLYRSGRLSRTASLLGSFLKIKPILQIDSGKLVLMEKVRGSTKVLKRMVEIFKERGTDFTNQVIGISHADDLDSAEKIAHILTKKLGVKNIVMEPVGSAVGIHTGPGAMAVFFLNRPYK